MTTLTLPAKELRARYVRTNTKPDTWYIAASCRLTGRWAKRMGNVLYRKTYVECWRRPEFRDFEIFVSMEYAIRPRGVRL